MDTLLVGTLTLIVFLLIIVYVFRARKRESRAPFYTFYGKIIENMGNKVLLLLQFVVE